MLELPGVRTPSEPMAETLSLEKQYWIAFYIAVTRAHTVATAGYVPRRGRNDQLDA